MESPWFDHLVDHAGALHVHTVKSDGAGTLPEIVAAAERANLHFLFLTDHDTRGYADEGAEGWHGNVLVIAGEEVAVGPSRFLALGHVGRLARRGHLKRGLKSARDNGGVTIGLPPEDDTAQLLAPPSAQQDTPIESEDDDNSTDWPVELLDGWEFWCALEDWSRGRAEPHTQNLFDRSEHLILRGPRRNALRLWDSLTQKMRILGFAGLNAHGRSWAPQTQGLPYEILFRSLSTHVLAPELPREAPEVARSLLLRSLRAGHFHIAQNGLAAPDNFRFVAEIPGRNTLLEGESSTFHPRAALRVRLPRPAEIRLVFNGNHLLAAEGQSFDFPAVAPGVYRVEAWIDRTPWIFSNPIWLAAPTTEERLQYKEQVRQDTARATGAAYQDFLELAT